MTGRSVGAAVAGAAIFANSLITLSSIALTELARCLPEPALMSVLSLLTTETANRHTTEVFTEIKRNHDRESANEQHDDL
jgi:hypothetical protein